VKISLYTPQTLTLRAGPGINISLKSKISSVTMFLINPEEFSTINNLCTTFSILRVRVRVRVGEGGEGG